MLSLQLISRERKRCVLCLAASNRRCASARSRWQSALLRRIAAGGQFLRILCKEKARELRGLQLISLSSITGNEAWLLLTFAGTT
jgi:hypothetical protein